MTSRSLFYLVVALLLLLPTTALAGEPWTAADEGLYATFLVFQYADYRQTRQIVVDPDHYELNPVLGENPSQGQVDTYFAATTIGHYLIADALKPRNRKLFIIITTIAGVVVVNQNYQFGIKF